MPHLTVIVLAAGSSRRMGAANKLLLPLRGKAVLEHAVEAVCAAPVEEVVVVTGHEHEQVAEVLAAHPVRVVHNADFREGMASSIRCGMRAASPKADAYLICLGDMPLISRETLALLCARFAEAGRPAIVLPVFNGRRGHPVVFDRAFREALLRLEGDTGARPVIEQNAEAVVEIAVDDPGVLRDVDTPAAYERLFDKT